MSKQSRLTLPEYEAATESERATARKSRWCKVGYNRKIGWVAGWYLTEGGSEDHFNGGARLDDLAGSEWKVRDFAGDAVNVEAWISFKPDGAVVGLGGCNHFKGSFSENDKTLRFSRIAATMMACPEPKMSVEMELFKSLDATRTMVAKARGRAAY